MAFYNELNKYQAHVAAIQEDGQSITYGDLAEQAQRIGETVGRRCLVFSFCQNTLGSLIGYVGFLNNRIVPLFLDAQIN